MKADDPSEIASEIYAECRSEGQSARIVASDAAAREVRSAIRDAARAYRLKIRTARMDDTVVAVRLDAAIWTEDTATMRRKLTPPERRS